MSINTNLRVDRMRLQNFRCFAECTIELHPDLTVLVAENGKGKTAILDAIGIALGLFVDVLAGSRHSRGFVRSDVRLVNGEGGSMTPALPTQFDADGYVAGTAIHWSRAIKRYGKQTRATTKDAREFSQAGHSLRSLVDVPSTSTDQMPLILPFVGFYGTSRLWNEGRAIEEKRTYIMASERWLAGYSNCLSPSASFEGVIGWFENLATETGDPRFSTELAKNLRLQAAVQEATRKMLQPTGWYDLDWDFERKSLVAKHRDHGRLPLSALSDGVRNTIALVADIARRCASLNPHFGEAAARLTPGVLLIDEVDMHLHPRWQQQVVQLLREAFPLLQMILTTHSPHVLSTVEKDSIRVIGLRDGQGLIDTPTLQTRGVESADVLASIMGVDPVPQIEEARWLSDYRALIEDGKAETGEAGELRSKLISHFGESHPLILDCERLIRFQSFKLKRNRPEES